MSVCVLGHDARGRCRPVCVWRGGQRPNKTTCARAPAPGTASFLSPSPTLYPSHTLSWKLFAAPKPPKRPPRLRPTWRQLLRRPLRHRPFLLQQLCRPPQQARWLLPLETVQASWMSDWLLLNRRRWLKKRGRRRCRHHHHRLHPLSLCRSLVHGHRHPLHRRSTRTSPHPGFRRRRRCRRRHRRHALPRRCPSPRLQSRVTSQRTRLQRNPRQRHHPPLLHPHPPPPTPGSRPPPHPHPPPPPFPSSPPTSTT